MPHYSKRQQFPLLSCVINDTITNTERANVSESQNLNPLNTRCYPPPTKKKFKKYSPNIFKQIHEHYLNQYHFHLKSNITVTRTVAHSLMAGRLASAGLCLFWAGQTFNQKTTGVTRSDCECDSRADGGRKRNTLTPTIRPSTSSTNLSTGQKLNKSPTAMRLQT
jgi:hypothetical protein